MSYIKEIKTRLLWLGIGLAASLLIANLINTFEDVLQQNIILAAFIPLIVYMSDAVGTQMESIIIRELNAKRKFNFRSFMSRQFKIVLPVAIIIAVVSAVILFFWQKDINLAYVVGIALFTGILSSLITGAVLPYIFWRLHEDPAEASGPIATVLQDFLSVLVFFSVAHIFFG